MAVLRRASVRLFEPRAAGFSKKVVRSQSRAVARARSVVRRRPARTARTSFSRIWSVACFNRLSSSWRSAVIIAQLSRRGRRRDRRRARGTRKGEERTRARTRTSLGCAAGGGEGRTRRRVRGGTVVIVTSSTGRPGGGAEWEDPDRVSVVPSRRSEKGGGARRRQSSLKRQNRRDPPARNHHLKTHRKNETASETVTKIWSPRSRPFPRPAVPIRQRSVTETHVSNCA